MSQSINNTSYFFLTNALARFKAMVVLPTPPFLDSTEYILYIESTIIRLLILILMLILLT